MVGNNPVTACHYLTDALEEQFRRRFVEKHAARTELKGLRQIRVIDPLGKNDRPHRRARVSNFAKSVEGRSATGREVDQKDVRPPFVDELHYFRTVAGRSDN